MREVALRVYAFLLVLLPRPFRETWGRDAVEMFADHLDARVSARGAIAVPAVFARAVADLIVQSVSLRRDTRGRGRAVQSSRRRGRLAGYAEVFADDMKHALRQLGRSPGFGLAVVATIAVGTGANTAMFSVVNGVLLRPLPFPSPDELVMVWERNESRGWPRFTVSPANYLDWRDRAAVFEAMSAYTAGTATLLDGGEPVRLNVTYANGPLFEVLGVGPALGRGFTAEEMQPDREAVVILSYALWAGRFGADSTILDRSLSIGGRPSRVVGILPPDFGFQRTADAFQPYRIGADLASARGAHFLNVVARLAPGSEVTVAEAAMQSIAANLENQYAETNAGWSAAVIPLHEQVVGGVRGVLLLLLGAVGFVLLIACVNVTNLLLARGTRRAEEFGVRCAIGAEPSRLARQVVAETVVLALLGAAAGLLLATLLLRVVAILDPGTLPRPEDVRLDLPVLAFSVAVALVIGLVVGLLPAIRASRDGMAERFGEGRRSTGLAWRRLRRGLLVSEVALAVMLTVGVGLLGRGLLRLLDVDPGFRPAGLVTARVSPSGARYSEVADRARFYDDVVDRLRAMPQIEAVGVTTRMPLTGTLRFAFRRVGGEDMPVTDWPSGELRAVDPGYFGAMGADLVRGRPFRATDRAGSPAVAIVNETLAAGFLDGRDPIGERIEVSSGDASCPCEIVGVVEDLRENGLDEPTSPTYYLPQAQSIWTTRNIVVRSDAPLSAVVQSLRAAVSAVDGEVPLYEIQTVDGLIDSQVASPRFRLVLFGLFALLALGLAAIGIYGVMNYIVGQRGREIGVRSALGAGAGGMVWMVEREALATTLAGIVIGLVAAGLLTRAFGDTLSVVEPLSPALVAAVATFLGLVGAAAALVPAIRASRVDPITVLRDE